MRDLEDIKKHFLQLELNKDTLDIFIPRKSILQAIIECSHQFYGTLLDVGCGQMPYKEIILNNGKVQKYVGLDLATSSIHNTSVADIHWDGITIPMNDETIDCAMATEVLEHSFKPLQTLKEINRVTKKGGLFFFTVPFIWPLHEVPHDAFRYTPFSLKSNLEEAGFVNIEIRSLGGWHASFAQMMGLWAKESKLNGFKKKVALNIAKSLIPYLLKIDNKDNSFGHHAMMTGLYGTAIKQ